MILNIGCGELRAREPGECLNIDIRPTGLADLIFDLNKQPWPVSSASAETIYAIDIIEHLDDVIGTVEECWRALREYGKLYIRTTAWDAEQSYTDPTHKHWFTLHSFDYFDPMTEFGRKYFFYSERKFKLLRAYRDGQELEFVLEKIPAGGA